MCQFTTVKRPKGGEFVDVDEWKRGLLGRVECLKTANEERKKELNKGLRSWRESARYRVRNLQSRIAEQIARIKGQANKGEKSNGERTDGDKKAGRESEHAEDLLGDSGRVDNGTKADDNS